MGNIDDVKETWLNILKNLNVGAQEGTVEKGERFQCAGNKIVLLNVPKNKYDLPDYDYMKEQYEKLREDLKVEKMISACIVDECGVISAVSRMALSGGLGAKIEHNFDPRDAFAPAFGNIVAEVPGSKVGALSIQYTVIGEVTEGDFSYGHVRISGQEIYGKNQHNFIEIFRSLCYDETNHFSKDS